MARDKEDTIRLLT